MRLYELERPIGVMATRRYINNLKKYLRGGGYPNLKDTVEDFIRFKVKNPRTQRGKGDRPFTGGPLSGISHYQVVNGKVMLIYRVKDDNLVLYDINDHDTYEGSGVVNLANFISSAHAEKLDSKPEPSSDIPQDDMRIIEEFLWEISASDPDIAITAKDGHPEDLLVFLSMAVPHSEQAILRALGGKEGISKKISKIIKNMGG